jgi:antitoxin component of MazEF toxin-antitoxin module
MPSSVALYRKLTKLETSSYYVVIPPGMIRSLGWEARQKLTVKQAGQKIVIRDWKK